MYYTDYLIKKNPKSMKTLIFVLSVVLAVVLSPSCSLNYVELDEDIHFNGLPPQISSEAFPLVNEIYVEGLVSRLFYDTIYSLSYGVVWDTSPDPTLENGESIALGHLSRQSCCPSTIQFEYTIPDLPEGKTYYVRAYARLNDIQELTYYGSAHEVTTGFAILFNTDQNIFQWGTVAFSTNLVDTSGYDFFWSFSDGSSYAHRSPVHTFNSIGQPEVQVRATSRSNSQLFFEAKTTFNVESNPFEGYWKSVDGGSFEMGCDGGDCSDWEKPVRMVTIEPFEIGVTEVTQKQWGAVVNDYYFDGGGAEFPVAEVSWDNIVYYFIPRLRRKTGWAVRLPTEAEWEYAARGGNQSLGYKYSGSDILDEVGWHNQNSGYGLQPVGIKKPNELGLYDMSGNVSEWVEDCLHNNYFGAPTDGSAWLEGEGGFCDLRVVRGGSYGDNDLDCRVSNRAFLNYLNYGIGFRLVRD